MKAVRIASLFAALVCFGASMAWAGEEQTIPPVETWEEMAVPYPDSPEMQKKFLVKWHKDPRGERYEGTTGYFQDPKGGSTLFTKCWDFWDGSGNGKWRDWSTIRVALLMDSGEWVVGDPGEMLSMDWAEDKLSMTMRFQGVHRAHSRTLVWK